MRNDTGKAIGNELIPILERLRALAKAERAKRNPEAEALEIAVVHIDSAIEILTD